ncbi:MAG: hypothetical protein ABR925_04830 [Acidimicrobiales bacterium]
METHTEFDDSSSKWGFYKYAVEHKDCYGLSPSRWFALLILPKRAFTTTWDEDVFRLVLRNHTQAKFRPS